MAVFIDQIGNSVELKTAPKRIVSLVPSQTELLYELGLEDRIVGITKFCVHPFHFKTTKKIVGGTKNVKFEKIKDLQPDLIICNKEENTLEMVKELRNMAPVWVSNIINVEDNLEMIIEFGKMLDCRTEAQKWRDKIDFAYRDFIKFMKDRPKKKAAYFIWKKPYMVAGGDNYINTMMRLNRFDNIYENKGRYPEIELKKITLEGDPDLVLLSSEPFPFKDEDAFEIGRFTHHSKTIFVDGEMFSWYGSRILKAFEYFKLIQNRIE